MLLPSGLTLKSPTEYSTPVVTRRAALRLHQVDGPLALLAVRHGTDGEKGEKASVRPPAGAGVVFGIPGELDVLGPGPLRQREEPDVGVGLGLFEVRRPHGGQESPPVG